MSFRDTAEPRREARRIPHRRKGVSYGRNCFLHPGSQVFPWTAHPGMPLRPSEPPPLISVRSFLPVRAQIPHSDGFLRTSRLNFLSLPPSPASPQSPALPRILFPVREHPHAPSRPERGGHPPLCGSAHPRYPGSPRSHLHGAEDTDTLLHILRWLSPCIRQ